MFLFGHSPVISGWLRRLFRRRRAPRPGEQEWLRLILLVRKLQHSQYAFVQRLDEIRTLTGALTTFRSDFAALHEQLSAARESAGELERGLSERLTHLGPQPDPERERAAFDQRVLRLESISDRLETLAAQAPTELPLAAEIGSMLARLQGVASRLDSAAQASSGSAGDDELAALYARIQELAEGLVRSPEPVAPPFVAEIEGQVQRLGDQIQRLEVIERARESSQPADEFGPELQRLQALAERFERMATDNAASPADLAAELAEVLERLETLAERLDQAPMTLPDLPADALTLDEELERLKREFDEERTSWACELESRRRTDAELESLRAELHSANLAKVELETRHETQLTEIADHAQRQVQRVEEELKKKKRGLSELTEQNILLQEEVRQLLEKMEAKESPAWRGKTGSKPNPIAPKGSKGASLSRLMAPEEREGPAPSKEKE